MDEGCPESDAYGSQPCTPHAFNPMMPSTSRVPTPARPSSTMSARQYGSPFRAQPQNMEPPNARVQELKEIAAGKRSSTQAWMQGSYYPPQLQSQQIQRAPSMVGSTVSNMSNMSQMSQMTSFSVLSVNTECGQFDNWIYQSQPALSKVSMSSTENQDPMKRRERMSIPDICESLRSTQVNVQAAAIRELEPIAKSHQLEQTYGRNDLQQIIEALFEVLIPRQDETDNVIRKTCEILQHSLMLPSKQFRTTDKIFLELNEKLMTGASRFPVPKPYSIYEIVIMRASQLDKVYESSAMVLLTHLCCKTYLMKRVFLFTEKMEKFTKFKRLYGTVVGFLIKSLNQSDTKPKNKGFAVSIIKNLCYRNPSIMALSHSCKVIDIFHGIMSNEYSDEDLLWPTMQALTTFCSDSNVGDYFVKLGGAQVLCGLLSHGSTRLLYELLGCLRKLADLPAIKHQDMQESIHSIIMLIGSDDPIIVERATGTLRNIALHNKLNKIFMVQNGVTSHVLAVLRTSSRFTCQPNSVVAGQNILPSIYENCLSILNNVTSMAPEDNKESAAHACRMIGDNPDSADILLHYFNVGTRKYRKMAVTVMKRVIETVPTFAEPFVDLRGTSNEPLSILLLKRAFESLDEWARVTLILMSCKQGPESQQRKLIDDERKDHEDIVKRSVGLLSNLCSQANPRFFERLKDVLVDPRNNANPILWLYKYRAEMVDSILIEWLGFILAICTTEWSLQNDLLYWFLHQANTIHQAETPIDLYRYLHDQRQKNHKIQELIKKTVDLYYQQYNRQQQRQRIMMAQQQQMQQHQM